MSGRRWLLPAPQLRRQPVWGTGGLRQEQEQDLICSFASVSITGIIVWRLPVWVLSVVTFLISTQLSTCRYSQSLFAAGDYVMFTQVHGSEPYQYTREVRRLIT